MSEKQDLALQVTMIVNSTISAAGCLLVLLSYWLVLKQHERKQFGNRLVAVEVFFEFMAAVSYWFGYQVPDGGQDPSVMCQFQAFWMYVWETCSVVWIGVMALSFYFAVVRQTDTHWLRRCVYWEAGALFVMCLAVAFVLFATGYLGDAGIWCWIPSSAPVLQLSLFYSLVVATWVVCVVCLVAVGRSGKDVESSHSTHDPATTSEIEAKEASQASSKAVMSRMYKYIIIFQSVWIFAIMNRTVGTINFYAGTDINQFPFSYLHTFFVPLQGFFNSLVYFGVVDSFLASCSSFCCAGRSTTRPFANHENSRGGMTAGGWSEADFDVGEVQKRSIFVTTFNLGEAGLTPEVLAAWLPTHGFNLYVIGVQESMTLAEDRAAIQTHLGNEFIEVGRNEIGSTVGSLGFHGMIALTVFAHYGDAIHVRLGKAMRPNVNMGKSMGGGIKAPNKGAVGMGFNFYDSSLAFVTAHFSSDSGGKTRFEQRNSNAVELLSAMVLTAQDQGMNAHCVHHHTFVFGDFNYRTADFNDPADILNRIHSAAREESKQAGPAWRERRWRQLVSGSTDEATCLVGPIVGDEARGKKTSFCDQVLPFGTVLRHDELTRARVHGACFSGFEEMPIRFPPTFRRTLGIGTVDYTSRDELSKAYVINLDQDNEENEEDGVGDPKSALEGQQTVQRKKNSRPPSYTDRIAVNSLEDVSSCLDLKSYDACDAVQISDHKPVALTATLIVHDTPRSSTFPVEVRMTSPRFIGLEGADAAKERLEKGLYDTEYYRPGACSKHQLGFESGDSRLDCVSFVRFVFPIPPEDPLLRDRVGFGSADETLGAYRRKSDGDGRKSVMFERPSSSGGSSSSSSSSSVAISQRDLLSNIQQVPIGEFMSEGLSAISDVCASNGLHGLMQLTDHEDVVVAQGPICLREVIRGHLLSLNGSNEQRRAPESQVEETAQVSAGLPPISTEIVLSSGGQFLGRMAISLVCEKLIRLH